MEITLAKLLGANTIRTHHSYLHVCSLARISLLLLTSPMACKYMLNDDLSATNWKGDAHKSPSSNPNDNGSFQIMCVDTANMSDNMQLFRSINMIDEANAISVHHVIATSARCTWIQLPCRSYAKQVVGMDAHIFHSRSQPVGTPCTQWQPTAPTRSPHIFIIGAHISVDSLWTIVQLLWSPQNTHLWLAF